MKTGANLMVGGANIKWQSCKIPAGELFLNKISKMRLTPTEKEIIVREVSRWFGQNSRVMLFGSRTNDAAKGGDIDLFIVPVSGRDIYMKKIHFLASLKLEIGEQKIDVVIDNGEDDHRMIVDTAREEGILLE